MSPKITVLMPVYNGLPYLAEAVESVLGQSFENFEFLIVDDASADGSVACIRSYKDPRIRLVCHEQNLGQARSLNKGLELARGEYVARLDQDDVCLPGRLAKQVDYLDKRRDLVAVCGWVHSIDEHGRRTRSWRREIRSYGEFLGYLVLGINPIWHPSVTFRRTEVLRLGGYDTSYAPAEDYELWVRLALKRWNVAAVPDYVLLQRLHHRRQSVSREEVQAHNSRRAHDRLVAAFCDSPLVERVAALLRMEDSFWIQSTSKAEIGEVAAALEAILENIRSKLSLSAEEFSQLLRLVYRRLGLGVALSTRLLRLPPVLFYPTFVTLSPLLVPGFRRFASALRNQIYRLPYVDRLF